MPYFQIQDPELQIALEPDMSDRYKCGDDFFKLRGRDGIYRIYVPKVLRNELVEYYHNDAQHPGINKTITIIHRYFDWPGLRSDVEEFIEICDNCKKSKRRNLTPYGKMQNVISTRKGELLSIDIFGPLPTGRAGLERILVVMDVFTKYVKLYPIKKADSKTCIRAMERYIKEFGLPMTILSDNGSNFRSEEWFKHWRYRNVNLRFTNVYHPAANPVERVMQTISETIRMKVTKYNHGIWPVLLPEVERRINTTEHIVTGVPPVVLHLGLKPGISGSTELIKMERTEFFRALDQAKKIMRHKLQQRNEYFVKKYGEPQELYPGEVVYVKTHPQSSKEKHFSKKLAYLFLGPYVIKKYQGNNSYLVENLATMKYETQHISNLKI